MSNILHSQGARSDVLAHVGENVRRLRQQAGLSQAALAEASGISRRMIVQVEKGDTNISLSSLDRLAEALDASFVDVVSDPAAHTRRINAVAWRGAAQDSLAVLLGSVPATAEAQLWSWSLGIGERYDAEADPEGWHEMVAVIEGQLRVEREEGPVVISAGDYTIYSSAQAYAYVNVGEGVTRFFRTVVS